MNPNDDDVALCGDTVRCHHGNYKNKQGVVYRVTADFVFYKTLSGKKCQSAHHNVTIVRRGPQYPQLHATTTTGTVPQDPTRPEATPTVVTTPEERINVLSDLLMEQLVIATPETRLRVIERFRARFSHREDVE